jgi:hypothetical protein
MTTSGGDRDGDAAIIVSTKRSDREASLVLLAAEQ